MIFSWRKKHRKIEWKPVVEGLEERALLSVTDYVLEGTQWTNPHITYSFAPDGVSWYGGGTNNIHAAFDPLGNWEAEIERAMNEWAENANITLTEAPEVGNNGIGVPGLPQGDPRFGDIRIGGTPMTSALYMTATTYSPTDLATTIGGDITFNTAVDFHIGSDIDIYSIALHEIGHALGLGHAANTDEVMYPVYQGIQTDLGPGDVAGLQVIYGPPLSPSPKAKSIPLSPSPKGSNPMSTPVPPMTPPIAAPVPLKKKPVVVSIGRRPAIRVPQPRIRPILVLTKGKKSKKIRHVKPLEMPKDPDIKMPGILTKIPVEAKK